MSNTKEVTYLLGTTYRQVKMHWMCDHNVKMPITDVEKKQLAQKRRLFSRICMRCGRKNPISSSRCRGCKSEDLRLKNRSIGVKK